MEKPEAVASKNTMAKNVLVTPKEKAVLKRAGLRGDREYDSDFRRKFKVPKKHENAYCEVRVRPEPSLYPDPPKRTGRWELEIHAWEEGWELGATRSLQDALKKGLSFCKEYVRRGDVDLDYRQPAIYKGKGRWKFYWLTRDHKLVPR
jgi:hypothetical protein